MRLPTSHCRATSSPGPRTGRRQSPAFHGGRLLALTQSFMRVLSVSSPEVRSEEHTSELQSLMRISYAVCCLKKKTTKILQKSQYKYNHSCVMINDYTHYTSKPKHEN